MVAAVLPGGKGTPITAPFMALAAAWRAAASADAPRRACGTWAYEPYLASIEFTASCMATCMIAVARERMGGGPSGRESANTLHSVTASASTGDATPNEAAEAATNKNARNVVFTEATLRGNMVVLLMVAVGTDTSAGPIGRAGLVLTMASRP